jgi:predicted DNA-binding protein (UPF0251 family)
MRRGKNLELTQNEREILDLLINDNINHKEAAARRGVSVSAIENALTSIGKKRGITGRVVVDELIRRLAEMEKRRDSESYSGA